MADAHRLEVTDERTGGGVHLKPPAPGCRVEWEAQEPDAGNASCLVVVDGRLLLVRLLNGKLDLPGRTSESGETAQCTAARETWEETGADVVVGRHLLTFTTGDRLYRCHWPEPSGESPLLPVPESARIEVSEIRLENPELIAPEDFRFPDEVPALRRLFGDALADERLRETD